MPQPPLPPGTLGLPLLGETLPFVKDTALFLRERFDRFGPIFRTRLFGDDVVCLGGHEAFTFFMNDEYFTRTDSSPKHLRELLNPDALPFIHDEKHAKRKRLMLKAFRPAALDTYLPALERVIARYAKRWERMQRFAWVPELEAMSFAIADTLFAGADPERDNTEMATKFGRFVDGMLAVPVNLPFTTFNRSLKARDQLLAIVDETIAAHRSRESSPPTDLLAQLMAARDDAGDKLSDRELRMELLHFYFAAHSALYSALSYHLMYLAQNPGPVAQGREEVAKVARTGPITMAVVEKLAHVDRLCLESRRLSAVVPLTFFGTVRKEFDLHGHHVPQGWKAFALIGATMNDKRALEAPEQFRPDRFIGEPGEKLKSSNTYVAQGGGPEDGHRCAGEKLAHVVMTAFTAHMLRSYSWELPEQDLGPLLGRLSPTPKDGLKVVFRKLSA